jgi:CheY-like chemotaxis protein
MGEKIIDILWIDDRISSHQSLVRHIEDSFGVVTKAQNVEDAIEEIMSGRQYDVILSEFMLPYGTNGLKYLYWNRLDQFMRWQGKLANNTMKIFVYSATKNSIDEQQPIVLPVFIIKNNVQSTCAYKILWPEPKSHMDVQVAKAGF